MKRALTQKDIYIANDYFDDIAKKPDKYEYNLIFDVSFLSIIYRKKLLDYLFRKLIQISYEDVLLFKNELIDYDMYDEYKQSIINGNDNFLKTCLIIYLEQDLKEEVFNNSKDMVNIIINSNEENILKLSNLLNISQFKCDDETFSIVKNNFRKLLFECNPNCTEEEKNKLLENYYTIMDNNQINIGNEKVLSKKN